MKLFSMNKKVKYLLPCLLLFCSLLCFAQQNKIRSVHNPEVDSLRLFIKKLQSFSSSEFTPTIEGNSATAESDTIYVRSLNNLALKLMYSNPDTAIILSNQALVRALLLFKKEKNLSPLWKVREECIALSYNGLGIFNRQLGNYNEAIDCYLKTLEIAQLLNHKKGIFTTLGNIGVIYLDQGNYPKALDYYFRALKIAEELKDKKGIARQLGNIGNVYASQGDYSKALDYYFKALKIVEELGDKNQIAAWISNIGTAYSGQENLPKALEYYFKALKMAEEIGYEQLQSNCYINIGRLYQKQAGIAESHHNIIESNSLFKKALTYYFMGLKIAEERGDKNGVTTDFGNIGSIYTELKKYKEAEKYLQKALTLSIEMNALNSVREQQQNLSELYEQMHQPVKALEHYKKYIAVKDSIFNEENTKKTVRSEMNFEFDKKQAIEKAKQEKQNVITQQEKQKQKIILILVSCFLMLVAVFASFMFNRWRITQKQKLIIEKQKEKIVDSITYAQLIQQSILLEESEIQKLLPDSFIYFQPKDIVSGDFYWCSKINNKIIMAAVDCTGHGVPGAFMSMIGNTLLNQIVNEKQITTPSEILQFLNLGVTEALHQKKEGALSNDGMDIAICCIDYSTDQIQYAGAQNPLYIVANNEITVINADMQSIGGDELISKKKKSAIAQYTNHIIQIKKDMRIFLFSDGYMDQFGGKDRKKFGVQKFKELLLNNQQLSMQQQKEVIAKAHQDWKGNTAQIDDILVIGLKL